MPATNLDEAYAALDLGPIQPGSPLYIETTIPIGNRHVAPLATLRRQLLSSSETDRFFLSGHIGSGKSTELFKLLADDAIKNRFYTVMLSIEPAHRPSLGSHELLFLIAAKLFLQGMKDGHLGTSNAPRWQDILKDLDEELFGAKGLVPTNGKLGLSFDLLFVKLTQELAVEQKRRQAFREFAESQGSVLVELINALTEDIQSGLQQPRGGDGVVAEHRPGRILVVVDDLEKLSSEKQFLEIFDTNLGALLDPRVAMLLTVPPSISFGATAGGLGPKVNHLRPLQVLTKTRAQDPTGAEDAIGVAMMRDIFNLRIGKGVFEDEVVREAALYSGGVLRDFFNLLRFSIIQAQVYGQTTVDRIAWDDTLAEERNKLARGLYPKDKEALRAIRESHALTNPEDLDYARRSVVLEHNHDGIWWEVSPLLWEWLEKK